MPRLGAALAFALVSAGLATLPPAANAAEYGTGPWVKGYSDIFAGIVPAAPGLYVRDDIYNYDADASRLIFNGRVDVNVSENLTADILALTYVTPFKILGANYAFAVAPSLASMEVNAGLNIAPFPLPNGANVGPFSIGAQGNELAQGDTAFAPLVLGWNDGKFHWSFAMFGFAPTGEYEIRRLANTSLNHWAIMPRFSGTYFDPATGWQVSAAAVYSVNFENPATDYTTGNILNVEGSVTKNFGALGVGAVAYGMIQTTGDSGSGARLGAFESRVYGVGPILTYTLGAGTPTPLTLLVKWYDEFGAKNTFEGNAFDAAASFKF